VLVLVCEVFRDVWASGLLGTVLMSIEVVCMVPAASAVKKESAQRYAGPTCVRDSLLMRRLHQCQLRNLEAQQKDCQSEASLGG
jgi:hypothetical protein